MSGRLVTVAEALNLLVPPLEPMEAADRLTQAIHEGDCWPICDGDVVPAHFRKRLMVVARIDPDGRWTADIVSAVGEAWMKPDKPVYKWGTKDELEAAPYQWEFDVDQVKALLPQPDTKAEAVQAAATSAAQAAEATAARTELEAARTEFERTRTEMQAAIERMDMAEARAEAAEARVKAMVSEPPSEIDRILETPPRRRGGAPLKYQWHDINAEIARRCHDPQTRLVKLPNSEREFAKDMLAWCQDKYREEPAESVMREAVRAMCAALRPLQK